MTDLKAEVWTCPKVKDISGNNVKVDMTVCTTQQTESPELCEGCEYMKRPIQYTKAIERGFDEFTDSKGVFDPNLLAKHLIKFNQIRTTKEHLEIFLYNEKEGIYQPGEATLRKRTYDLTQGGIPKHQEDETIHKVQLLSLIDQKDFDNLDPKLVFLQNCILDLSTYQTMPFTPDLLATSKLPVKYDPNMTCPAIMKFLNEVLNLGDIDTIQELIGYCLYRNYPIQKAFLLIGEGSNGKSTLLGLIRSFIGPENTTSVELQSFQRNRFATSHLYRKMANIAADLSDKAMEYTGIFKMLTGGDSVPAEFKNRGLFDFVNYAKLIFSCNKAPQVLDDTDAFYRRWIFITFSHKFEGPNCNPNLLQELTTPEELSGLLNFVLEGLKRLLTQNQFTHSDSTEELREHYTKLSNPLKAFIEECCEIAPDKWVVKKTFYEAYCQYCNAGKFPIKDQGRLKGEFAKAGYIIEDYRPGKEGEKNRPRAWKGIGLLPKPRLSDEQTTLPNKEAFRDFIRKKSQEYPDGIPKEVFRQSGLDDLTLDNFLMDFVNEGFLYRTDGGYKVL